MNVRIGLFALSSILAGSALGSEGWDAQFGVPGAEPGGVTAVVLLGDKLIVGGNFVSIGGIDATNLAQFDGRNWAPIADGVHGSVVNALAVAGDSLFVGGWFTRVGELPVGNIARWDGTNWWDMERGVNANVFALAWDGANLYAGGHFTTAGSSQVGKVARWDGTNWSRLGLGITPVDGFGAVDSLAVGRGGLYAGGRFRVAGDTAATNIARWDGTNWHALGNGLRSADGYPGENGSVRALAVAEGILYAGGLFRSAGTIPATNIAAWDGRRWLSVSGGVDGLGSVRSLIFSGRELIVGGSFTSIGGVPANRVARWNGESWSALGSGVIGPSAGVLGLASAGSELVAVGAFTSAGGKPSTNIALWHIPHALAIRRSEAEVRLSWPETGSNFVLESSSALGPGLANWQPMHQTPLLEQAIFQVGEWVVTDTLGAINQSYRLRRR